MTTIDKPAEQTAEQTAEPEDTRTEHEKRYEQAKHVAELEAPKAKAGVKEKAFEVGARDLIAGLASVMLHVGDETILPALHAVSFEVIDGELWLLATDRYTVGGYHMEGEGDELQMLIDLPDVKQLLASLKNLVQRWRNIEVPVRLVITDEDIPKVRIEVFFEMITLRMRPVEGTFPRWRSLVPTPDLEPTHTGFMAYNPQFMAKFAKVASERNEPMLTWSPSSTKPTLVTVGAHFVGLIMPVRAEPEVMFARLPQWVQDKMPKPEPEAKPTVVDLATAPKTPPAPPAKTAVKTTAKTARKAPAKKAARKAA